MSTAEQKQILSSSNLLLQTETLSLPEWLEVSWFYPEGFRKEFVLETSEAWLSFGNEIVYKFLKVPHSVEQSNQEIFKTRWRLSCEEIADNQQLAPDLYLGLRLLRWVDDEPQWISERPHRDVNPFSPPEDANDVAIVLRRIPQEDFLHRVVESEEGISETRIRHVARKLQLFHQANATNGTKTFLQEPRSFLAAMKCNYLEPLRQFSLTDGSFLDSFTQIAFQEIRAYLQAFFDTHSERLLERG